VAYVPALLKIGLTVYILKGQNSSKLWVVKDEDMCKCNGERPECTDIATLTAGTVKEAVEI